MSIEAMKRALDAIDSAHADMRDEITALRQAIEAAEKIENPPIRIQNHTHTYHPMRHWDRTCPACLTQEKNWKPNEIVYRTTVFDTPKGFRNIQNEMHDLSPQAEKQEPVGIVQRISIAGFPMSDSSGVEWLSSVQSGAKLYTSPPQTEKQEPVAWMYVNRDGECEQIEYGECEYDDPSITFLYTAPPRKPWVGLTGDEINDFSAGCHLGKSVQTAIYQAAAKLKEKNGA